jgi:Zn-dependent protease with chaperone function
VLIPLASACIQACARNPLLMNLARGGAALAVAAIASGLVVGGVVLVEQLRTTRHLVRRVLARASRPPARLTRLAGQLGIEERLTYVLDPAVYAFCYGFLSPRICISSGMAGGLSLVELRAVLLHEAYHLRQRDPLKVLMGRTVAGAFYLLPLATELRDRYLVEKELSADAHVVERLSPEALAAALLKIYRGSTGQPVADFAAAAVGPFNLFGERIRQLTRAEQPKPPLRRARVAATVGVVLLILLATAGSGYAAERALGGSPCCTGTEGSCSSSAFDAGSFTQ